MRLIAVTVGEIGGQNSRKRLLQDQVRRLRERVVHGNGLFTVCITLPLQSRVNALDVEIQTWFEYVLRNARGVV